MFTDLAEIEAGLSPRLRGNAGSGRSARDPEGSIPALAGERFVTSSKRISCRVYPRACGGTHFTGAILTPHLGLSPRLRGNVQLTRLLVHQMGSIPALAGERASLSKIGD